MNKKRLSIALLGGLLRAAALALPAIGAKAAVVLTTLHSFQVFTNGENPHGGLVRGSDGNFYGTTEYGGTNSAGTVFEINPNGSLTSLYSFGGGNDGANPYATLVQGRDGDFYGTTYAGGTNGYGTVFKIGANGSLTSLYSFTGTNDGANPQAGLVQGRDGSFYGTTYAGGTNGSGTVFKISTNGTLTGLHSFTGTNDGANPEAGLAQGRDGNFYGTTYYGGTAFSPGYGTVFEISTNGALISLYSFSGGTDGAGPSGLVQGSDGNFHGTTEYGGTLVYPGYGTVFEISTNGVLTSSDSFSGADGASPQAGLAPGGDGSFYGTTSSGGTNSAGTVFQVSTNGELTSLYSFSGASDGANPYAGLVLGTDGNLYGTTYGGGTNGSGAVFQIGTNGALTRLYSFAAAEDGANPQAGLVQGTDGNLYGTTYGGGTNGSGTVFQISTNGEMTSLYSFTGTNDGANPHAGLVQGSDGSFYGTTEYGGTSNLGTVFQISAKGNLNSLYSFTGANDGANPTTGLVQGGEGHFYGITSSGGASNLGTVFQISANGELTTLYSFTGTNDGANPNGLVQGSDGNFYGTTLGGGPFDEGGVFRIDTNGALSILHSFSGIINAPGWDQFYSLPGNDGALPGGLVQGSDGSLYGTTYNGGPYWSGNPADFPVYVTDGTLFKLSTDGMETILYSFGDFASSPDPYYAIINPAAWLLQGSDGNFYGTSTKLQFINGQTWAAEVLFRFSTNGTLTWVWVIPGLANGLAQGSDGSFYGTTQNGGIGGEGSVFRMTITAPVAPAVQVVTLTGSALTLTWSTQAGAMYQVQYNSALSSSNWVNLSSAFTATGATLSATDYVTNGPQRFYRVVLLPQEF